MQAFDKIFSATGRGITVFFIFALLMRKHLLFVSACALAISSCGNNNTTSKNTAASTLVPGSIIAADSEAIKEDNLNDFSFSVKIIADSNSNTKGSYTVQAAYGVDNAEGQLAMPKNAEYLKPLLRKGDEPYTYIVGFKFGNDTTFHDYFEISAARVAAQRRAIKMEYIKAYTFE
ncbi:MAG: hypothetical protein JSS96_14365 [Bacteroidetes bacterium]|nr:hypothetical protein [Bacteroidota bacterium]